MMLHAVSDTLLPAWDDWSRTSAKVNRAGVRRKSGMGSGRRSMG